MAITAKIKKRKVSKRFQKTLKHLESLRNLNIKVGYFDDSGKHSRADVSYAQLAFWHEFGVEGVEGRGSMKYPARFLFTISSSIIEMSLTKSMANDIRGIIVSPNNKRSTYSLANKMVAEISDTFGDPILGRNSQATINRKGHDSPLIETGELQDNLGYKINDEGVIKQ